jgi:hypothetical protein
MIKEDEENVMNNTILSPSVTLIGAAASAFLLSGCFGFSFSLPSRGSRET